ncbi:hypothetical protein BDV10DRAFT_183788 [Aspergillus recurvatus]
MTHREDGKTKRQLVAALDYVGLFLFLAGCILLLLGLNWGGRNFPWSVVCHLSGRSDEWSRTWLSVIGVSIPGT